MKLFRFGAPGAEKPGVVVNGVHVDATDAGVGDYDESFFAGDAIDRMREWASRDGAGAPQVAEGVRLGAPIIRPSKIVCVGLNYIDHVRETKGEVPEEPVLFFKASSALSGPNDDVWIPRGAEKVDWEVELAIVIGKRAKHVDEADALSHVAGYALHNDYSERDFQLHRSGQWVKGKSCDTFAPIGPYLVTPDDVGDVHSLRLWLTVNGESRQDSNTSNMIFGVPKLVSYISRFMSLLPGDVISTGTPPGVGLGMNPQVYLAPGDVVECGIDQLGSARQEVVPEPA